MKKKLLPLVLVLSAAPLAGKVKLPTPIGDNMVLRQQTEVKLWGEATPRAEIRVSPSWTETSYTTRADDREE